MKTCTKLVLSASIIGVGLLLYYFLTRKVTIVETTVIPTQHCILAFM